MRVVTPSDTARAVRDMYGAPTRCLSPYTPMYHPGSVRKVGNSGFVERTTVPCGYCRVCVATRKSNWTGRLIAEALTSSSVAFVTLTYRKTPEEFVYSDIQQMLKTFRERLYRERGTRLRFFCSGERGELRGRHHWHLLFFFDKPTELRRTKKRQLWHFWPHGWAHIQMLKHDGSDQMLRKIRYTAKYCVKDAAHPDRETFMRCSLKPGIGGKYFAEEAVRLAGLGLPAMGGFKFRGVEYRRGPKKGKPIEFRLTGASARNFLDAYEEAWPEFHGHAPIPATKFRATFSDNYVSPVRPQRTNWETTQESIHVRRKRAVDLTHNAYFFVQIGRDVAMIGWQDGFATVYNGDEKSYLLTPDISAQYIGLTEQDVSTINAWLREQWSIAYGEVWTPEQQGQPKKAVRRNTFDEANAEQRIRYAAQRANSGGDQTSRGSPTADQSGAVVAQQEQAAKDFHDAPIWGREQAEAFARRVAEQAWESHDFRDGSSVAAE